MERWEKGGNTESDMRIAHVEVKGSRAGKIIGAAVVGLALLASAMHMYGEGWWKAPAKPVVTSDQLPHPSPPQLLSAAE